MPSASVLLLTYNQAPYVAEAFKSLCRQTTPAEIVLSDDGSTDGTYATLAELVEGADTEVRDRIRLLPWQRNQGLAANLNRAVASASGAVLVIAGGDDLSAPDRVFTCLSEFERDSRLRLVATGVRTIWGGNIRAAPEWWNPESDTTLELEKLQVGHSFWALGAATSVHREVFSQFGPLNPGLILEDHVLPIRALVLGCVRILAAPLVDYRLVPGSLRALADWPECKSRSGLRRYALQTIEGRRAIAAELEKLWTVEKESGVEARLLVLESMLELERAQVAVLDAMIHGLTTRTMRALVAGLNSPFRTTRSLSRRGILVAISPSSYERLIAFYRAARGLERGWRSEQERE